MEETHSLSLEKIGSLQNNKQIERERKGLVFLWVSFFSKFKETFILGEYQKTMLFSLSVEGECQMVEKLCCQISNGGWKLKVPTSTPQEILFFKRRNGALWKPLFYH
jgi:hypothetical protein